MKTDRRISRSYRLPREHIDMIEAVVAQYHGRISYVGVVERGIELAHAECMGANAASMPPPPPKTNLPGDDHDETTAGPEAKVKTE